MGTPDLLSGSFPCAFLSGELHMAGLGISWSHTPGLEAVESQRPTFLENREGRDLGERSSLLDVVPSFSLIS